MTVWYNPLMDKIGVLNGYAFCMDDRPTSFHSFILGPRAAQRLAGAKWIKIGDL